MSGNNILNTADFVVNYGTMLESKIGKATGENPHTFWRFAVGECILFFLGKPIALRSFEKESESIRSLITDIEEELALPT